MGFWDFFWLLLWGFFYVCYLLVLFQVILDLFRDDELSGWGKAVWVVALVLVPAITLVVYLIVRGNGMGRRMRSRRAPVPEEDEVRIINAPSSRVEQIAQAKSLLDSGAITPEEYERLKALAIG